MTAFSTGFALNDTRKSNSVYGYTLESPTQINYNVSIIDINDELMVFHNTSITTAIVSSRPRNDVVCRCP